MVRLSPDGEIEHEKAVPLDVGGSWTDKVRVCNVWARRASRGEPVPFNVSVAPTYVYISGNPAKYLQGHNIYGTDDLSVLASKFFATVAKQLNFSKDTQDLWEQIGRSGKYEVTRIDITYNFRVDGGSDAVNTWIRSAHTNSRATHKNASVLRGNTLYFGKHSRRHTIKIYNKYQDLLVHKPCQQIRNLGNHFNDVWNRIYEDANGLLRVEQTFRAKKLRDLGIDKGWGLTAMAIRRLYDEGMKQLSISQQIPNNDITKDTVGRGVYTAYLAWKCGEYDANHYGRATVHRHRRALLPFGVDILLPNGEGNQVVTVPLIRVLEAIPAEAPSFYRDFGLLAA